MLPLFPGYAMKRAIREAGTPIEFYKFGAATPVTLPARVRWLTSAELANAIEAYPLVVTIDSDSVTTAPAKGDEFVIEGARRGVMDVKEIHWATLRVAYQCAVLG